MLVYKNGEGKDILGFQCDLCDQLTLLDVIPNEHGEFRYICPKCGHRMKELNGTKEEETKMVNTYTVANAAKRLNCSTSTIARAIQDGRFHDCFMEDGYHGRPAWLIPSDQVEEWVTKGGFIQTTSPKSKLRAAIEKAKEANITGETIVKRDASGKPIAERFPWGKNENTRTVFDPEIGKNVPVLDLLSEEDRKPIPESKPAKQMSEFDKRVVHRVAKSPTEKKYVKVLDRGDTDGDEAPFKVDLEANKEALKKMLDDINREIVEKQHYIGVNPDPVVRTNDGFRITIPSELIEDMVHKQVRNEIAGKLAQLRAAFDQMNEELKKLEEAIA